MVEESDEIVPEMHPRFFLEHAKAWRSLYHARHGSSNGYHMKAAHYCLLFSLELFMKAFLSTKDPIYSTDKKLRTLGHELRKIAKETEKFLPENQYKVLDGFLSQRGTLIDNYPEARYPMRMKGGGQLYGPQPKIIAFTKYLEKEIKRIGWFRWYPRYKKIEEEQG